MTYYIKLITGFREDQYEIIPMQEAHKAYYLFRNPDERGVFDNGVAIIGRNIQEIKPAWNETMGYNTSHKLDDDDWNEIENKGVDKKMKLLISNAQRIGNFISENPKLSKMKLGDILKEFPQLNKELDEVKTLAEKLLIK